MRGIFLSPNNDFISNHKKRTFKFMSYLATHGIQYTRIPNQLR